MAPKIQATLGRFFGASATVAAPPAHTPPEIKNNEIKFSSNQATLDVPESPVKRLAARRSKRVRIDYDSDSDPDSKHRQQSEPRSSGIAETATPTTSTANASAVSSAKSTPTITIATVAAEKSPRLSPSRRSPAAKQPKVKKVGTAPIEAGGLDSDEVATAANSNQESECDSDNSDEGVEQKLSSQPTMAKKSKPTPKSKPKPKATAAAISAAGRKRTTTTAWKKGEAVPYGALVETFGLIESTTKRLEIQSYLTEFFCNVIELSPHCLVECVYLCINRIGPEYDSKEIGVGESLLMRAVANATGRDIKGIKSDVDQVGDLGTVAATKGRQKTLFTPKPLTVSAIFKATKEIANMAGQSSQQRKVAEIQRMIVSCQGSEVKYLIRSLEGKLRIGLAEKTVLVALAHAAATVGEPKFTKMNPERKADVLANAAEIVKEVYSTTPSYDLIIPAILEHGIKALPDHCQMTPGIPLKPMLAHPTKSITEVLDRFEGMTFICEYKYDGERAQIHKLESGRVVVYSRNSEDLSAKYPDIVERIPDAPEPDVTSFVIDCEAVAWDREKKCILPFQVLSTRKRKDVQTADIQVQVCVFAFDLLYLNGKTLVKETLKRRRELLSEHFTEIEGQFQFAKGMESNNIDEIQTFLDQSVAGNCEGLMVKTLEEESSYEPSKRSRNWLKVKKDYIDGLGDSLDLVVIGGYLGRGKRAGCYGGYLLACYDDDAEEYQAICKIGTGFSEEQLQEQAETFKSHVIPNPRPYYKYGDVPNVRPDVWFAPAQVWEVKAADLSISPVYRAAAGLVDSQKGISLRFPRFLRVRTDKTPEQATTASQVASFYRSQNINSSMNPTFDDNDDY